MEITRTNIFSGEVNALEVPITQEQFDRWQSGELIQNVMPELDIELREFLISGFLPGGFDKSFGPIETKFEGGGSMSKSITFDKEAQDALPQHIKDKMKTDSESSKKNKLCKTINMDFGPMVNVFNSFGFDVASFDCINDAEDCCKIFNSNCIIKCGCYYNVIIDL